MEYELINPSDPYTFIAEDKETAALTIFLLGTLYGAETENREEENSIPVFILGGSEEWYIKEFGRTPEEGFAHKKEAVKKALASFMLGHFRDRQRYEAALQAIDDPDKKKIFIENWQDACSSLNDIGTRAHQYAEQI